MKKLARLYARFEGLLAFLLLTAMVFVPLLSVLGRNAPAWMKLPTLPGAGVYMSHLLVFVALVSGLCVSRGGRNITLNLLSFGSGRWQQMASLAEGLWKLLILVLLTVSTLSFFLTLNLGNDDLLAGVPQWLWMLPLPLATAGLLLYQLNGLAQQGWSWMLAPALLLALFLAQAPLFRVVETLSDFLSPAADHQWLWAANERLTVLLQPIWLPAVLLTIVFTAMGLPVYIALAGVAIFSFMGSEGYPEVVINDFYALLTENVVLQSLPLFAFAGFILSEGRSANRLVDFLQLLIGRVPGGVAIMAILLSAFFTTLTGASGVTILALGGLFAIILEKSGYSRPFTLGLLTACGSIGLLFPPSLPVIMYGVLAGVSVKNMFIAGFLPGLLLLAVMVSMVIWHSRKIPAHIKFADAEFKWSLLWKRLRTAGGELLLPVLLILGIFFLKITLVELSAFAVVYCLLLTIWHRDYTVASFTKMLTNYMQVLGGILLVIGFARGLADYLALHDVPTRVANFIETFVDRKWQFLLLLNLMLLITGALMDIYSAIIIVVPLVLAMGAKYQIPTEQLGIIFLANLELGYMTPPIGLSLFLARYRFEVPVLKLYRYVLPFLAVMLAAVLLITYWPWLSLALLPD